MIFWSSSFDRRHNDAVWLCALSYSEKKAHLVNDDEAFFTRTLLNQRFLRQLKNLI